VRASETSARREADLALKNTKFAPGTRQTLIGAIFVNDCRCSNDSACWRTSAAGLDQQLADDFHLQIAAMAPHSEDLKRVERTWKESLVSQWLYAHAIFAQCAARRWQRAGLLGAILGCFIG